MYDVLSYTQSRNKRINYVTFSKEDENIMLRCMPELISILNGLASMGIYKKY